MWRYGAVLEERIVKSSSRLVERLSQTEIEPVVVWVGFANLGARSVPVFLLDAYRQRDRRALILVADYEVEGNGSVGSFL